MVARLTEGIAKRAATPAPKLSAAPKATASVAPIVNTFTPYAGSSASSGGGTPAAAATQVAARPSLTDYINNNFLKQNQDAENARDLSDFDSDTTRQTALTQADQATKRQVLQQNLDDEGQSNAEDMAGRGLLRSGLTLQAQDKINTQGAQQSNSIDSLLTNLLSTRSTQRLAQEAANRQALASVMSKLTDSYNAGALV